MGNFVVEIQGLKELQKALKDYSKISSPIIARAINASLAEMQKTGIDEDDSVFQFKTPRAKRTGFLATSFSRGIKLATPDNLIGWIGPTVFYAPYLYYGTSRGITPNKFMDRIAQKSQPNIDKHFITALNQITSEIAKRVNLR